MSVFSGQPDDWQRLDWRLLQHGGVALYFQPAVLEQDLEWLQANHYDLYQFQCKSWHSPEILHQDFKRALQFPDYYGQNFAALDECLGDLPVPEDGGAAIVLQSFDAYAKGLPTITRRQSSQTDAEVCWISSPAPRACTYSMGSDFSLSFKATIPGSDLNDWGASVRPGTPRSGSTKAEVFDYQPPKERR
jgi:hypothetical protein